MKHLIFLLLLSLNVNAQYLETKNHLIKIDYSIEEYHTKNDTIIYKKFTPEIGYVILSTSKISLYTPDNILFMSGEMSSFLFRYYPVILKIKIQSNTQFLISQPKDSKNILKR